MAPAKMVLPGELVEELRNEHLVLFVGSGPSVSAGYICWDHLINEMKKVIRREDNRFSQADRQEFLAKSDHLDIADVFRKTMGDSGYFKFLRAHYRKDIKPSQLHFALARMRVKTIFTTNYDKLLETAFHSNAGLDAAVIVSPDQLGYIGDSEVRIVKLHGDIDHPKSIILTRTDYNLYSKRHQEFVQALASSLAHATVLFVGYGLRDPDFRQTYNNARQYPGIKQQSYAIVTRPNEVDRELWERDDLKMLPVAAHDDVPHLLDRLIKQGRGRL